MSGIFQKLYFVNFLHIVNLLPKGTAALYLHNITLWKV